MGCGGELRDHCGKWMVGFGVKLGNCSTIEAELWGILHRLQVAWKLNLKKVILVLLFYNN